VSAHEITSLVIAGWTGRDEAALKKHIRELEVLGVKPPKSTPVFYRVSASLLTCEDAIEVSGGTPVPGNPGPSKPGIKSEEKEAYFRTASKEFKEKLEVPIILVGGIRSPNLAEKLLAEGYADYFSMSRPFIREPDLVKRWASGDRSRSRCVSDNQCFGPGRAGEGVYCVTEKKEKEKRG